MKLALNGLAHYTDFDKGYKLYLERSRKNRVFDKRTYKKVIKEYCRLLAEELEENGVVDLPCELGTIATAIIRRKPQYRGNKFIGYGKYDWATGHFDGNLRAFGMVYLPKHNKVPSLRCFGYVANRQLFKRMSDLYKRQDIEWRPIDFKDEMV